MKKLPFLALSLALASAGLSTARAGSYTVIDLGVANGWSSRATGVNNSGVVVGNISHDNYDDGFGTYTTTAFRYSYSPTGTGLMESLRYDTPNDGPAQYGTTLHHTTTANAINNAGQIAGSVDTGWAANGAQAGGIGPWAAIIAPGSNSRTIYPGRNENPYNGNGASQALAINSSGQIAGYTGPTAGNSADEASILNGGGTWDKILERYSYVFGMNDSGQFVGRGAGVSGDTGAFLYSGGVVASINNTLGASNFSIARDINNNGIVVGRTGINGTYDHAYRRDIDGTMHDLQSNPIHYTSEALAINDGGLIVGTVFGGLYDAHGAWYGQDYRAFLYSQTDGMIDLNTLLSNSSNLTLISATAISENGYIAGYGINRIDGQEHAFLLAPPTTNSSVPDTASTMGLMLLALVGMVGMRRFVATQQAAA